MLKYDEVNEKKVYWSNCEELLLILLSYSNLYDDTYIFLINSQ